ncbi:hypothetical protein [Brevibacillus fulvus]|uniref:Uncharacterized protein n=1 Tax=Brevibacillus fulvus TaxID=1125967 RepID=A0A938XWF5_9BACL|nr:hypothetical protein [Brevibacillus fulvus]MBM7588950.1 hypothetical protein [Brevibacillus fulvus]
MRIIVLDQQNKAWIREIAAESETFKQIVGEFTSQRLGHYQLLVNQANPQAYPRIITKVDTDGDGDMGSFTALTDDDLQRIQEELQIEPFSVANLPNGSAADVEQAYGNEDGNDHYAG